MDLKRTFAVVFFFVICSFVYGNHELSYDFYEESCPQLEKIVKAVLAPIFLMDLTSPAALLRLMFHDCQVQGCDASILLDSSDGDIPLEMASNKNFGIRKRELIGTIKSSVEAECPRQVSCSDILILAAREAVALSGGPHIRVPLGRRDSNTTSFELADASLPSANTGIDQTIRIFAKKGMTMQEIVAILGAHTLGITHCLNVLDRLNRGEHTNVEKMAPGFELFLKISCPLVSSISNATFVSNDLSTFAFDNQYYRDAIGGRGILRIDAELSVDPRTARIMAQFSINQDDFFRAFASAFLKLSVSDVLTGNQGVVRKSCNAVE